MTKNILNDEKPLVNRLISRKEVAFYLGVTTETVKRMARDGRLKQIVISRNVVRYHPDEVKRLIGA